MKYPRLPKKLNKATKLSEESIKQIKELLKKNFSQRKIAREFLVSQPLISYWAKSKKERKEKIARQYKKWDKEYNSKKRAEKRIKDLKSKVRKLRLQGEKLRLYKAKIERRRNK